ncbi:uncharacterized protein LOC103504844 [Diaphorina citri]|uniref:Uncharacterized protein LOC103504844 n=1 Tax=Diaphorina citri TaxID=121845 RepID=A0A1S3CTC5_DIACI|nr:uncharacterized protein LOC103504844 [Diaphorina citri]
MATEVNHQDTDDWKKLGEFSQDSREKIENKSNEDTSESNQPCDVNQDRPSFDLNRTMHTRKPAYAAEIERQRYQAEMEKKRNEAEARADRNFFFFDGKWRRLKPNQGSVSDQYSETQSDNFERNDRLGLRNDRSSLRNDRPSLRNDRAQLGHHRPSLDSEEFDPEWDEREDGRYHYREEDSTGVNTTQAENSIHTSSNTESSEGVARPFDKNRTMYPTKPPHWQEVTRKKMISDKEKQYNMDEMNVAFTDR